jgi:hypothetical protein
MKTILIILGFVLFVTICNIVPFTVKKMQIKKAEKILGCRINELKAFESLLSRYDYFKKEVNPILIKGGASKYTRGTALEAYLKNKGV